MPLRILLFGTGEFALPPFRALLESPHDVAGVFTQPDRTGRGHHRHVNPVKVLAEEHQVPVFQPPRVNNPEVLDVLRQLSADVFIVAAYGQILRPGFLAIPPLGAFNLHGSLLPRHRGAAPVQYSVWQGDRETGVAMFQIEPSLDSGPLVGEIRTKLVRDETAGELMLRLAELSVPLTLDVIARLETGTLTFQPQDDSHATLAPRIRKEDGLVDWTLTPDQIDCHVRAMQPWPKAVSWLTGETCPPLRCIIVQVNSTPQNLPPDLPSSPEPGTIVFCDKRLLVQTGAGVVEIVRLQPQGKSAMAAAAFLNGHGVQPGMQFRRFDDAATIGPS